MEGQVGELNPGPRIAEPPVFASGRGLKGKLAVRLGILALIALITVWLTALILGAIGFGNLPDLHLPGARGSDSADQALASPGPAGLTGVLTANGVAAGGGSTTTGSTGGSTGSGSSGTPGSSGSGGSTGNGRGTPTDSTSGGRGAPDTTPNGKNTPGNSHGKGKGLTK